MSDKPASEEKTFPELVRDAQREVASWSKERRDNVRLEGSGKSAHTNFAEQQAETYRQECGRLMEMADELSKCLDRATQEVMRQTLRATQAEQSLALERAAREKAEGALVIIKTRHCSHKQPDGGACSCCTHHWHTVDQALAQEGGKP